MANSRQRSALTLPTVALAFFLVGCSQAPPLQLPDIALASNYKESAPWIPARPIDELPRGSWWTVYRDPELNALQQHLMDHSPDLAAALARYRQSVAATEQIRASQFPTLTTSLNAQQDRQSETRPLRVLGPLSPDQYRSNTLGFDLAYEIDLWGRVRDQVASGEALEQAAQADLQSARLSLQALLTDTFIVLRGLDRDAALLLEIEVANAKALELTTRRHDGGLASGVDLARARGQLEAARSQVRQSQAQRALIEHAIASLVGATASSFAIAPRTTEIGLPQVPTGLPSTLLQRRPDIAGAERRVAAANAGIGVARSAYFPAITLSALAGYQSDELGTLVRAPNSFWAVGPTLFLNLFDAGKRQAEVARMQATLDEAGAKYRSVVLGAFQQVEDGLAQITHYGAAAASETSAVAAAQQNLALVNNRYREGAASYLEVVTAQNTALQAQRSALDLSTRRLRASVQLIRALGGGWSEPH